MSHIVTLKMAKSSDFNMCEGEEVIMSNEKAFKRACDILSIEVSTLSKKQKDGRYGKTVTFPYDFDCNFIYRNGRLFYENCKVTNDMMDELNILRQFYSIELFKQTFGEDLITIYEIKPDGRMILLINGKEIVSVKKGGDIRFVYTESSDLSFQNIIDNNEFKDFATEINRATRVEPKGATWSVDFNPCGVDEVVDGFANRSYAINYEINRIKKEIL